LQEIRKKNIDLGMEEGQKKKENPQKDHMPKSKTTEGPKT